MYVTAAQPVLRPAHVQPESILNELNLHVHSLGTDPITNLDQTEEREGWGRAADEL